MQFHRSQRSQRIQPGPARSQGAPRGGGLAAGLEPGLGAKGRKLRPGGAMVLRCYPALHLTWQVLLPAPPERPATGHEVRRAGGQGHLRGEERGRRVTCRVRCSGGRAGCVGWKVQR